MKKYKTTVVGASGKMGQALIQSVFLSEVLDLHAAIDLASAEGFGDEVGLKLGLKTGINISDNFKEAIEQSDVVIDFTRPEATLSYLAISKSNKTAHVIGTTGFNKEEEKIIHEASQHIPVCFAPNMSVGVNVLISLVEKAAAVLGNEYDIEVIEAHHKHKVDAPSGTALRLGQAAADGMKIKLADHAVYTRHGRNEVRQQKEIGFSTVRAGDIVGEHTVLFAAKGERVELVHKATDRANFAAGAIKAAEYIVTHSDGLFDMRDVLGLK